MNMTPQPEANSHGNPKTKLKKLETPSPRCCVSASTTTYTLRTGTDTRSDIHGVTRLSQCPGRHTDSVCISGLPCSQNAAGLRRVRFGILNFLYVINVHERGPPDPRTARRSASSAGRRVGVSHLQLSTTAIPQRSRHYCGALPLPPRGRIPARWLFTSARHGIKTPRLWLAHKVHDRAAVRVQVSILHIETARQARVRVEDSVKYALVGEFTLARLDHLGRSVPRPVVLPARSERVRRVVRKEPFGREWIIARRANVGPFIGWTWNVPIPRG
jgi:hypothetical protein